MLRSTLRAFLSSEAVQFQCAKGKATMAKPASAPGAALSSQQIFDREDKYGAHNYHPLPVALCRGKGDNWN